MASKAGISKLSKHTKDFLLWVPGHCENMCWKFLWPLFLPFQKNSNLPSFEGLEKDVERFFWNRGDLGFPAEAYENETFVAALRNKLFNVLEAECIGISKYEIQSIGH